MSTATHSLVGGMFAVATALDAVVVCEAAGAAAVAFSAAAFHRRQRRVIVAATATATAISAPIAPRPDQVHSHRRALTRAYVTGRRTYVTGRSVGTLGTVPRSPLLASSSPAAQQPSMAPPAATVVLALERPTAVPRRRRRPQPRSLGLVVTLGHPLGTPKLQTRPSVAREASFCAPKPSPPALNGPIWSFASFQTAPTSFFFLQGGAGTLGPPTNRARQLRRLQHAGLLLFLRHHSTFGVSSTHPHQHHLSGGAGHHLGLPLPIALARSRHLWPIDAAWPGLRARAPSWPSAYQNAVGNRSSAQG